MNEFLRKFDTIRFIAPWSIFRNFLRIFHFLNSNLNFEFWSVGYRPKPEPVRTGLTGNRSNRTGSHRLGEPWNRYTQLTGTMFTDSLKTDQNTLHKDMQHLIQIVHSTHRNSPTGRFKVASASFNSLISTFCLDKLVQILLPAVIQRLHKEQVNGKDPR